MVMAIEGNSERCVKEKQKGFWPAKSSAPSQPRVLKCWYCVPGIAAFGAFIDIRVGAVARQIEDVN